MSSGARASGAGAYRGQDARIEHQRAIDEAEHARRTLRGENSALESECPVELASSPFGESVVGVVVLTVAIVGVIGGLVALLTIHGGHQADADARRHGARQSLRCPTISLNSRPAKYF